MALCTHRTMAWCLLCGKQSSSTSTVCSARIPKQSLARAREIEVDRGCCSTTAHSSPLLLMYAMGTSPKSEGLVQPTPTAESEQRSSMPYRTFEGNYLGIVPIRCLPGTVLSNNAWRSSWSSGMPQTLMCVDHFALSNDEYVIASKPSKASTRLGFSISPPAFQYTSRISPPIPGSIPSVSALTEMIFDRLQATISRLSSIHVLLGVLFCF